MKAEPLMVVFVMTVRAPPEARTWIQLQYRCPDIVTSLLFLEHDLNDDRQAVEIYLSYALHLRLVMERKKGTGHCFDPFSRQVFGICIASSTLTCT